MLESYSSRLNAWLNNIDVLAIQSVAKRIVCYLGDRAIINGKSTHRISHYQIANDLHLSRIATSIPMKKLASEGTIQKGWNEAQFLETLSPKKKG